MQAQLDLACRRAHAADLTEGGILHVVVGIPVAGDVEDVEEVSAETDDLFTPDVKVLEEGSINLAVSGSALGVDGCSAEGGEAVVVGYAVSADAVVRPATSNGGRIGPPPVVD